MDLCCDFAYICTVTDLLYVGYLISCVKYILGIVLINGWTYQFSVSGYILRNVESSFSKTKIDIRTFPTHWVVMILIRCPFSMIPKHNIIIIYWSVMHAVRIGYGITFYYQTCVTDCVGWY